ncbi:Armadillo/beta-catenin-like repeat [Phytophthora infestans]|uniref:Armadillo/beta-catenin-like repeat n=1 Tax=Phytophthora infestans TaxID=4787 RepID=A0A833VUW1_PHYIN|nr:Armadillo/beta-catenin-like repeat [Phytophthora infestans]
MDLTALWNRERSRLTGELHLLGVLPANGGTRASFIAAKSDGNNASTGTWAKEKASTSSTTNHMQDRVFQLMVDTSTAPLSTEPPSHLLGSNEFATEYAERAVRRYVPQPAQQLSLSSPAPTTSNSVGFSSSFRGPAVRNQSTRASAISLHAPSPSPVLVSQSSVQTFPKSSQILARKNGRKRAGTEYSSQALKPYGGDIFGTRGDYIDGMLYMSRMKRSYQAMVHSGQKIEFNLASPPWGELTKVEGRSVLKDGVSDAFAVAGGGNGGKLSISTASRRAGSVLVLANRNEDDDEELGSTLTSVQRKQQQRCSLTLSNWSFNPENARLMVQENVVEALIRLCKDGDKTTRLNCVTAFMNLSHLCDLRRVIVQQGAVKTVAEIVNDTEGKTIRTACAITLCNLCSLQGEEGLLVEDGAVSALSTLINEHEKVSHICRCALFNLTCVSQSYHKIEIVLKAFISLTSTRNGSGNGGLAARAEEEYDDVTAKALCNLSNLKRIRLRLMEEGIVSAITSLLHPNIPSIQELLAHILLNLSRLPACRNEMVAKGCMGTLVALAGASNATTTKCLIGTTLWNLSKDPGNAVRMVQEGLLLLVNELCREDDVSQIAIPEEETIASTTKDEEILQVCARTLYNVSCCEDSRSKLVERDAVNTLSWISRRSNGDEAKQMCILALCNLLSVQKAAADIVTAGAITALIQLSMAPGQSYETRNLFSKALHGLCDKAATRAAVTDAGVIPALLFLSSTDNDVVVDESAGVLGEIRARCTAAFACLAADSHTAAHVCNAAVVQCVTRILVLEHSSVTIERYCCSCLSLLCRDEQCSLIMVEVGAIEMVLATCVESHDQESKASCCHVLASVSRHPSCCMALVRMGVISVLATLANIKENATIQRCCAITLANLSVEPEIRVTLASAGIVAIVSVLSNSYSEDSQRDCAKVLCNLSCIRGNEAALVGEGAVSVLMMVSMVRAVSVSTKETCIRALLNLLNAETVKRMVKEGLVKILSAYSGLGSKQVATFVTIIFGKLLNHPVGRTALCAERSSLHALFQLMTYDLEAPKLTDEQKQLASLHENLLSELVYYENSRMLSVQAGILDALQRISVYEEQYSTDRSHCAQKALALVFFTLAKSEDSRIAVASSSNLGIVLKFLNLHAAKIDCAASECAVYAAATLCWLGWHENTRKFLQTSEIPRALAKMLQIHSNGGDETLVSYSCEAIKTCVLTLCCLANSTELLEVMLTENVVAYLNGILTSCTSTETTEAHLSFDEEFVALVCILFRQLSHATGFATAIADQPAPTLELFCNLVEQVVAKQDVNSALDCADALCSIVFTSTLDQHMPGKRRESLQPPQPPRFLVDSRVLNAIGLLLSEGQLPETRWRCSASLWALSSVSDYRKELVDLGVTPMLVNESYRAAKIASLSALQCCAGALCSLTIVPEERNSAKMVEEGAMPALIQLAKLENETIREHCTLALSNLSGPSPKVESGAVSALLNISLDFSSSQTAALRRASCQQQSAVLSRPPLVWGERHKQFAVLPNFSIQITQNSALDEQKFEAKLSASTPPPPQLPAVAADLVGSPTRHPKSETTSQPSHRDEGNHELVEAIFFDKVDPEESLAFMMGTGEREDEQENTWTDAPTEHAGNQEQDRIAGFIKRNQNHGDVSRISDKVYGHKTGVGASMSPSYALSPLSRVVIRKAHAVQVARKLKDATTRKRKEGDSQTRSMLGSQSSPSLSKFTLTSEPHKIEKKTRPPLQLASLSASTSTSSLSSLGANENIIDAQTALLAAVSAAGIYGAAPPRRPRFDEAKSNSISLKAKQKKRAAKTRRKERGSSDSNSYHPPAQPKTLTPATSIEAFQDQAKLLGLWS